MNKFCPFCGAQITAQTKFCPNCGKEQPAAAQTAASSAASHPSLAAASSQTAPSSGDAVTYRPQRYTGSSDAGQSSISSQPRPTVNDGAAAATRPAAPRTAGQQPMGSNINPNGNNANGQPRAQFVRGPYNGTGQPGLFKSFMLWFETAFKPNQCMGRADFWWGYLGMVLISIVLQVLLRIARGTQTVVFGGNLSPLLLLMMVLTFVFGVIYDILAILTWIQRLHDVGHSGWNLLWCLTIIGGLYPLILAIMPTKWESQRWPRNDYSK